MAQGEKGTVVLVAFYNVKALGVRYLESALTRAGYRVATVFFKRFNSRAPSPATAEELELLCRRVRREKPMLIGLSVMSSMYLDSVCAVLDALGEKDLGPVACGGAYASLEPEYFLRRGVPYVIRLDGEGPVVQLADALREGRRLESIPSLCYLEGDAVRINPVGCLDNDLDRYGLPTVNSPNACLIDEGRLTEGDPQLGALSYEVIASRGCPFTCSYCSCVNLRRLYPAGVHPVRTRSVESVIQELEEARRACRSIAFIHFYDEIFPNLPGWVDEFVDKYRARIGLPFSIWSHPKMVDAEVLRKLVRVGLVEVIMGIQSGSSSIRREVFHRYETNEDIVQSTRTIRQSDVFWASYDFMLQHPFETADTMRETYELVKRLEGCYELQLHGLNFLPGTDIVPMAVEQGRLTREEMDSILYAPMAEQFNAYWKQEDDPVSRLWYQLIFLWQFPCFRRRCLRYEQDPLAFRAHIGRDHARGLRLARLRYLYKKARVVLKRLKGRR